MVEEMVNCLRAYFLGLELETNVKMVEYEYDMGFHKFSVLDKTKMFRNDSGRYVSPVENLFRINENDSSLVMTISKRYATNIDIQYGYENCLKHVPAGNKIHFRYKIENIQQLQDLLIKYEDYIDYMIKEKRGKA